jgi:hypothetical protein
MISDDRSSNDETRILESSSKPEFRMSKRDGRIPTSSLLFRHSEFLHSDLIRGFELRHSNFQFVPQSRGAADASALLVAVSESVLKGFCR